MMTSRAEDILDSLPHRPPFRFLTEILQLDGPLGRAIWRVVGNEDFFAGHFPNQPIVPGVLIGEALAQLSGLVVVAQSGDAPGSDRGIPKPGKLAHLSLRYYDSATPPNDIALESRLERELGSLRQFDVKASVSGRRVAQGELTLAIPGQIPGAEEPKR